MFESLENVSQGTDRKTWIATTLAATLLFGGLGGTALWLLGQKTEGVRETEVEVTFVPRAAAEPVAEPEPPPPPRAAPPPPSPSAAVPTAVVAGPAPNPTGGVVSKRRAFQAPSRVPTSAPAAVDPIRVDAPPAVAPPPEPAPTPTAAPVVTAPPERTGDGEDPAPERPSGPIMVPEAFEGPVADEGNRRPDYPSAALRDGREGDVVIELRVRIDGTVAETRLVSGDEPFASAALEAVRSWRYRPARLSGTPIEVARRVRLPFKVRG